MKRIAIVISILVALALVTAAMANMKVTGKWRTTITTPADAAGTWTLNFKKNGTGTTAYNGQLFGATFTFKGSVLTAGPGVCPTYGTYRIHRAGKHLTLTVINDPCTMGRKLVLPGHTWTKVS